MLDDITEEQICVEAFP